MTLDELVTKLKRIERAAQRMNENAGAVVFQIDAEGAGALVVEDSAYGDAYLHHEFTFDSPYELEIMLGGIVAGMETDA